MRLKKFGRDLLLRNVGFGSLIDKQYWKQNVSQRGCTEEERETHTNQYVTQNREKGVITQFCYLLLIHCHPFL